MITELLAPTERLEVPLGDACYSEAVVQTAARLILERLGKCHPMRVEQEQVDEVVEALQPWQPLTKEGKFPKRMASWAFKEHGVKLPEKFVATLGNYLALDLPYGPLHVQITKEFDWKQGEFGDAGSCFFNDSTFELLTHSNAYALRFYTAKGKGEARAILLPARDSEALVVNAYGASLDQVRSRMRVLCPDKHLHVVKAYNRNRGLYINLDMGLLVAESAPPDETVELDFMLPRLIRDPRDGLSLVSATTPYTCPYCEREVQMADVRAIHSHAPVCYNCFETYARRSAHSGRLYMLADMVTVQRGDGRDVQVSKDELSLIDKCDLCHELVIGGRVHLVSYQGERYNNVCYYCLDRLGITGSCDYCGAYKKRDETCYCRPEREEAHEPRRTVSNEPSFTTSTSYVSFTNTNPTEPAVDALPREGRWRERSVRYIIVRDSLRRIRNQFPVDEHEWVRIIHDENIRHDSDTLFLAAVRGAARELHAQRTGAGEGEGGDAGEPVLEAYPAGDEGVVHQVRDDGDE